jgi:uncharacterized phage-like protein YoqJ
MREVWPTVMVTGHRPQGLHPTARSWVRSELERLALKLGAEYGTITGISGMALGSDLWWADAVYKSGLRLWAHVPFPQQADPWTREDRDEWTRLLGYAGLTTTYGAAYDVRFLHARNDGMIKASDAAICVFDPRKTEGGSASAVRKLRAIGMPIIHVNPETRTTVLRRTDAVRAAESEEAA